MSLKRLASIPHEDRDSEYIDLGLRPDEHRSISLPVIRDIDSIVRVAPRFADPEIYCYGDYDRTNTRLRLPDRGQNSQPKHSSYDSDNTTEAQVLAESGDRSEAAGYGSYYNLRKVDAEKRPDWLALVRRKGKCCLLNKVLIFCSKGLVSEKQGLPSSRRELTNGSQIFVWMRLNKDIA